MNRSPWQTRTLLGAAILAAASLCALAGCQDSSAPASAQDRAFEEGAGRPPSAATLYSMSRILAKQGKNAESQEVLKRIIRDYPECMPAYADLAESHLRQGRVDAAVAVLTAGLGVRPQDATLINDLGMCHLLKKDYAQALAYFTKASAIVPDRARYRSNMAVALGMLGRDEEALDLFGQVLPPADALANLRVVIAARAAATAQTDANN